jgi:hypothetical protein
MFVLTNAVKVHGDKNWIVLVLASVVKVPGGDSCSVHTSCVVNS